MLLFTKIYLKGLSISDKPSFLCFKSLSIIDNNSFLCFIFSYKQSLFCTIIIKNILLPNYKIQQKNKILIIVI